MCYNPIYAILTKNTMTKEQSIRILPKNEAEKYKNHTFDRMDSKMLKNSPSIATERLIELPCGQCLECRMDYARKWADRLSLEALSYNDSEKWFLTLTYDNDNIQKNESKKNEHIYSLNKKDLQLFMKRLRKSYSQLCVKHGISENKLRFFAAGEYGDNSYRPHYHIIIFGMQILDLVFYKTSAEYFDYFISEWLNNIWQKGFVVVAKASWQTFNYVARYIMKKQKGENSSLYEELGVESEFCTMSRKPGLGYKYFQDNYNKIYQFDEIYFEDIDKGGMTCRPP